MTALWRRRDARPFKTITFCYHPNTMRDGDFDKLEMFAKKHKFSVFPGEMTKRKINFIDKILMRAYYARKRKQ